MVRNHSKGGSHLDHEGSSRPTPPYVTGVPPSGGSWRWRGTSGGIPPFLHVHCQRFAWKSDDNHYTLSAQDMRGTPRGIPPSEPGVPRPHPSLSGRVPPVGGPAERGVQPIHPTDPDGNFFLDLPAIRSWSHFYTVKSRSFCKKWMGMAYGT